MAERIDGMAMRAAILDEARRETARLRATHGVTPGLATILVGDNPASVSYVSLKVKTALALGFHEIQDNQPADISEAALLARIDAYNRNPAVHGILVQLPLPPHIDEGKVIRAIDPDKDVDGFHPVNLGRLVIGGEAVRFAPCTPAGIQEMLVRSGTPTRGAEVVIIGRSAIVGRPLSIMLGQKGVDATVTLVHSRSEKISEHCRRADILVAAAGVPRLVKADWVKPGAAVIDVGVNRVGVNPTTGKAMLTGDVDFDAVAEVAGKITPVPGGVGPMTIAMLMKNTLRSAWLHAEARQRQP